MLIAAGKYLNTYFNTIFQMSIRKLSEQNIRKITKIGRQSLAVTLPVEILRELKWKEKQKVVVKKIRGGVQIKDWKK